MAEGRGCCWSVSVILLLRALREVFVHWVALLGAWSVAFSVATYGVRCSRLLLCEPARRTCLFLYFALGVRVRVSIINTMYTVGSSTIHSACLPSSRAPTSASQRPTHPIAPVQDVRSPIDASSPAGRDPRRNPPPHCDLAARGRVLAPIEQVVPKIPNACASLCCLSPLKQGPSRPCISTQQSGRARIAIKTRTRLPGYHAHAPALSISTPQHASPHPPRARGPRSRRPRLRLMLRRARARRRSHAARAPHAARVAECVVWAAGAARVGADQFLAYDGYAWVVGGASQGAELRG